MRASHLWRYLLFLGFRGYAQFDWEWIIAMPRLRIWAMMEELGLAQGATQLVEEAIRLGFEPSTAVKSLHWAEGASKLLSRILHWSM